MKALIRIINKWVEDCPRCQSSNVTRTADHCSDGYNGYKCNECGLTWGN